MSETDGDDWRLTAVCTDGTRIGCENFKATDSGVLLTEDLSRNMVFGFVPHGELRFVLPTDAADDGAEEDFDDPLKELPGVGATYAKRLRSAGYDSRDAIANAEPAALAEETGAREPEAEEWVEQATDEDAS